MPGFRTIVSALVMAGLMVPAAATAQQRVVPESQVEVQLSFAPLVRQTRNAVVNVYAERMVQRRVSPFAGDPFFEHFFGQRMPNRTERQSSLGSGVIVGANGTVVTNNHVIDGADDIKIALADGREYPVKVVLKDDRLDLAVLKIDGSTDMPTLPIADSDQTEVGDLVLAIGNPFGVGQTVTSGIVSALARNQVTEGDFGFFIQTDAAINPGNSGGALVNMRGELIGINTAIFSRGGGSNGVGFAIPANLVRVFLEAAERGDKSFERPYVGASFEPVTSDVAEALGLSTVRGALVVSTVEGGPAESAGLRPGQVVTAVNGIPVEHPDALGYRLTTAGLGQTVTLSISDNGKPGEVEIALATAPENRPRNLTLLEGRTPFAGARIANLSPRLAYELRMAAEVAGVVVTEVMPGSPASRLGFIDRDIILSVNGEPVGQVEDLVALTKTDPGFWRVEIERDGQRIRQIFR